MRDIIVFGTGKYFETKKEAITKKYNIVKFLDNKVDQSSFVLYEDTNIKIINPMDLEKEDHTVIFLMSVHFVSMWKQLCNMGVNPQRLVFPYAEAPFFENEDALNSCLDCINFSREYFECVRKDGETVKISDQNEWKSFLRTSYREYYPMIEAVSGMDAEPISRQFGTERGMPVDRYYIEEFLRDNAAFICGDVLEIEDNTYTIQFGKGNVRKSIVMDVSSQDEGVSFNGNLETGKGIKENIADCFILTQTLMYIYDLKNAAHNIGRILKPGGIALITCSGISQNSMRCMDNYGCYFNFNQRALERMFDTEDSLEVIEAGSYGNVKTVTAHLNGLCCEDLEISDFQFNDEYYPLIVYAVVKKNE